MAIENYTHYVRVLGIFLSLIIVALYYLAEAVQVSSHSCTLVRCAKKERKIRI